MYLSLQDRIDQVLNVLPGHWNLSEYSNNRKLVELICERSNDLYDSLSYMRKMWYIDTAEGGHLDNIGRDLGLSRNGMSDDRYKRLLKVKEYLDLSNGTIPEIDTILNAFLEGNYVGVKDAWQTAVEEPAAIVVEVDKNADSLPFEIINKAKAGGVKVYYEALFDDVKVIFLIWAYEHRVYYPITNIKYTGYQKGMGFSDEFTLVEKNYTYTVYYPVVNQYLTGGIGVY